MADEDLDELYKVLTEEEALRLTMEEEYRYKRARINPGAPVKDDLGEVAREVVASVAVKILEGTIPIRTAGQAKDVAVAFHAIHRLEAGKSTQSIETMSRSDREAMLAELTQQVAEREAAHAEGLKVIDGGLSGG